MLGRMAEEQHLDLAWSSGKRSRRRGGASARGDRGAGGRARRGPGQREQRERTTCGARRAGRERREHHGSNVWRWSGLETGGHWPPAESSPHAAAKAYNTEAREGREDVCEVAITPRGHL